MESGFRIIVSRIPLRFIRATLVSTDQCVTSVISESNLPIFMKFSHWQPAIGNQYDDGPSSANLPSVPM